MRHDIILKGYGAFMPTTPSKMLCLGTAESYGIEQLNIVPGAGWEGLMIKATFQPASSEPVVMVVGENGGAIDVPPEATMKATAESSPGVIVFSGVADGVQRISANLAYTVIDHAPVDGKGSEPTPNQWEQLAAQYQSKVDKQQGAENAGKVLGIGEDGLVKPMEQTGGGGVGNNGATFTPAVSEEGVISWTNDGGLPNPEPVNIKGAPGKPGNDYILTKADKQEIAGMVEVSGGGSGISTRAKTLLITVLRNAIYSTDQSANITALENALGGGGTDEPDIPDIPDEPDEPVVKTYTITRELINVVSNNNQNSITEGAAYTATLSADDGYVLDSVTVTMGGVDVTADVYADGVITIPTVTGNIEIVASAVIEEKEAVLPTDGLLGYWDLRNSTPDAKYQYHVSFTPTLGEGAVINATGDLSTGVDEYGAHGKKLYITDNPETYPNDSSIMDLGSNFTFIGFSYGEILSGTNPIGQNGVVYRTFGPGWGFGALYNTESGTEVTLITDPANNDPKTDYNLNVKRVDGNSIKVIMDTSSIEYDGTEQEGFVSWWSKPHAQTVYNAGSVVALAIYNRALTDAEIEEAREFFKTLEVTA